MAISFYLSFPDVHIRRQNSCESISSLNSLTSMSSIGSLKDQDAKKKKKKSWVRMNGVFWLSSQPGVCLLNENDKAAWMKYDQSFPPLCCVILLFQVFEVSHCGSLKLLLFKIIYAWWTLWNFNAVLKCPPSLLVDLLLYRLAAWIIHLKKRL